MRVSVITSPAPIVTPADVPGDHAADDAAVAALIQAVTENIDGPTGWLGRALGPQTLELAISGFCGWNLALPLGPIIGVVSVRYLDRDNVERTVSDDSYRLADNRIWFGQSYSFPAVYCAPDAVRIRYRAGYNGTTGAGAGELQTGPIPERARQAIILSVRHLKSIDPENLYVRAEEVDGVGRKEFGFSDRAAAVVQTTCDRLLNGLRRYT